METTKTVEVLDTDENYVVVVIKGGRVVDGQVFFHDETDAVVESCHYYTSRGFKWVDADDWTQEGGQ